MAFNVTFKTVVNNAIVFFISSTIYKSQFDHLDAHLNTLRKPGNMMITV